jgi:hypothetical protein
VHHLCYSGLNRCRPLKIDVKCVINLVTFIIILVGAYTNLLVLEFSIVDYGDNCFSAWCFTLQHDSSFAQNSRSIRGAYEEH